LYRGTQLTHQRDRANEQRLFSEEENPVEVLIDLAGTELPSKSLHHFFAGLIITDWKGEEKADTVVLDANYSPDPSL
jgi:hypothetical protein